MYSNKIKVMTEGALIKLVYEMAPGESIRCFDDGMLSNNTIKGIVSCSVSYDQENTRLIYSLNVKPSLASMLRQSMTKNMVLSVFSDIASVMENSQSFMLSERNFVLDPRYIFIDTANHSVEMIYIPTNDVCGVYLSQFIKTCISLGVFDTSMDSSYLTRLLNFVNTHTDVSASGLKKLIDEMMNNKTPEAPARHPVQPAQQSQSAQSAPARSSQAIPSSPVPRENPNPQTPPPGKSKNGIFGSLLGKSKETAAKTSAPAPGAPGFAGIAIPGSDQLIIDNAASVKQPPKAPQAHLVDKTGRSAIIDKSPFWIGKSRQSQTANSLIIDGDAGVSKNHAYIENSNGKYYIVDPRSTNGTFINGKIIPKNTRTELKDGMKIGIWKEEFIFRVK